MKLEAQRLPSKRALVTGAGSGIGRAVAIRLAAEGAKVAVTDVREAAAAEVAEEIATFGGSATALACDIRSESSVQEAFLAASAQFGGLDTVVAVAGVINTGELHELPLDSWNNVISTNLTGTFLTCKYALQAFLEGDGGSLVLVASTAALIARPGGSAACYGASKAGVVQLSRNVAVAYADRKIRANCVCPGSVQTHLSATSGIDDLKFDRSKWIPAPMPRRADPAEVATAISYLCSDDASFITGATLLVDGGMTAI